MEFSKWWTNEFKNIKFPSQGTVFDYYLEAGSKKWAPWSEMVPKFEFDAELPLQVRCVIPDLVVTCFGVHICIRNTVAPASLRASLWSAESHCGCPGHTGKHCFRDPCCDKRICTVPHAKQHYPLPLHMLIRTHMYVCILFHTVKIVLLPPSGCPSAHE